MDLGTLESTDTYSSRPLGQINPSKGLPTLGSDDGDVYTHNNKDEIELFDENMFDSGRQKH